MKTFSKIKQWFKKNNREDHIEVGKSKALAPTIYAGGVVKDIDFTYTTDKEGIITILEGTYSSALGSFSSANATNVVSFSQSATEPTSWILSSEVDGTTDLLTALNNGSDGNKEWFEDVYNVNDNLHTFVSAAPSIEVKALDMTFRPIGAKMYPEVMKITNTGFSPVELYHSDYSGSEFIKLAEDVEFPVVIEPNSSYNVYFTTDHTMEMEEGGVELCRYEETM